MRFFLVAAACAVLSTSAHAATVASGATRIGDTGGITLDGPGTSIASDNSAYNHEDIGADWVWGGDIETTDHAGFTFAFDLTGYDLTTAVLSGLWGVDNVGSILLNGTEIASLTDVIYANFRSNNVYNISDSSLFSAGLNTVSFLVDDRGGPGAFRATALVEADKLLLDDNGTPSEVPLPAGGLLLVSGLGLMVLRRRFS